MPKMKPPKFPLPKLVTTLKVVNEEWDEEDEDDESYYVDREFEVEVLTLNFNSGTMRVRIVDMEAPYDCAMIYDIDAAPFFEQFKVVAL